MKKILTLSCILMANFLFAQTSDCDKCDLRYIKIINDNFKSLTEQMVERFLCSLDYSCNLNPNYIQTANKTLYAILEYKPELIVNSIKNNKYLNKKIILEQIRNPYKTQKFSLAYNKVRSIKDSSSTKNQVSASIKIAAQKYKIKIQ